MAESQGPTAVVAVDGKEMRIDFAAAAVEHRRIQFSRDDRFETRIRDTVRCDTMPSSRWLLLLPNCTYSLARTHHDTADAITTEVFVIKL